MNAVLKPIKNQDYEIADLSLAAWGRKELNILTGAGGFTATAIGSATSATAGVTGAS